MDDHSSNVIKVFQLPDRTAFSLFCNFFRSTTYYKNVTDVQTYFSLKNYFKMKLLFSKILVLGLLVISTKPLLAQTTTNVSPFTKIIISPNIQVTFVEGNNESVTIEKSTVISDKIHIEVKDNTLRIYLDGQKDFPKNEKTNKNI